MELLRCDGQLEAIDPPLLSNSVLIVVVPQAEKILESDGVSVEALVAAVEPHDLQLALFGNVSSSIRLTRAVPRSNLYPTTHKLSNNMTFRKLPAIRCCTATR